jgi:hypothetical protein
MSNKRLQSSPWAKALAITGVSIILGGLFAYCFWGQLPGLSFPLYVAAVIAGLAALGAKLRRPLPAQTLWLLIPLGFFSAMVAFRASPPLTLLNLGASLMLLLLIARLVSGGQLLKFNLADYAKLPFLPFKFLAPLGQTLSEVVALRQLYKDRPVTTQIIKGLALTLPVLLIFLLLFASADLVFQKHLAQLFNIHLSNITVARTVLILFVASAFAGAYSFIFGAAPQPAQPTPAPAKFTLGQVESSILLGSVNALFFLFILIQLAYLFGGTSNISAEGFTYAEYARKGFFELIAVAVISAGLLWAADRTVAKTDRGHTLAFRLLSSALIIQVILIMVSAFKRLYLYEQAYGFTTLRLYSHAFTVLLAVIFILLLIKILKNQAESTFAFPAFITALVFLAGLNLLNPDAFIARQNLTRYHQTGKLDGAYLGRLSADARPEVTQALNLTTGQIHADIETALQHRTRSEPYDTTWQSWNYSRQRKP